MKAPLQSGCLNLGTRRGPFSATFLDIGDKLVEPDGTISKEVMPDKLHAAGAGYVRLADALSPRRNELLDSEPPNAMKGS